MRQPRRAVLTYRYLEGQPWADVVDKLGKNDKGEHLCSAEYVRKEIHDNGLLELFPHIPHEYDELPEAI